MCSALPGYLIYSVPMFRRECPEMGSLLLLHLASSTQPAQPHPSAAQSSITTILEEVTLSVCSRGLSVGHFSNHMYITSSSSQRSSSSKKRPAKVWAFRRRGEETHIQIIHIDVIWSCAQKVFYLIFMWRSVEVSRGSQTFNGGRDGT